MNKLDWQLLREKVMESIHEKKEKTLVGIKEVLAKNHLEKRIVSFLILSWMVSF
ncbi:hypothetical protein JIR001_15170 [Polycladomyces abyssicola]|uniref:Uncharacterized protein n=1 Tax=Polycladomyces abyssicola TaxID=1125966 RepID=A0A8D5ZKR0_9BACL|nr:hypothetical protein [Polycladomyces abyssicola]BCU81734.1 hypothetical protein JIR001_15170 [Polycladomyces abyssicola]